MAEEAESQQQQQNNQNGHEQEDDGSKRREGEEGKKMNISLSIWPPTQRTREAVIKRMVDTISTPSTTLSKRYGTMPLEDASPTARLIEEEAFAAASASASTSNDNDDDGIETLQIYSKEISKRMLEAVKSRAPPPSPSDHSQATPLAATASEDIASLSLDGSELPHS